MKLTIADHVWLNSEGVCSAQHLTDISGLSSAELDELIASGFILPIDDQAHPPLFQLHSLVMATTARRLRDDFELDQNGLLLALSLMRRIDDLQAQLRAAHASSASFTVIS